MQIIVRDNNVEQALRALKKKLQREGVYREMKLRRHYEKPSEKRARERAAAIRRARKLERFLTTPFFVAESFNSRPGRHVSLAETIAGCNAILGGELDARPEYSLLFIGEISQAA